MPWSISKAKTAACPQQFIWQYMEKHKKDEGLTTADTALRVGRAMHEIYEGTLKGGDPENERQKAIMKNGFMSVDYDLFEDLYKGVPWFMSQIDKFIRHFVQSETQAIDYLDLVKNRTLLVERRFSLTDEFNDANDFYNNDHKCFLRGVIDVIIRTNDGKGCIVLDHKSSAYPNMKMVAEQLRAYTIAAFAMFPDLEWTQCGIHFMALQEIKMTAAVTRNQLRGECNAMHYYLTTQAVNVLRQTTDKAYYCKWCSWKTSCNMLRKQQRKEAKAAAKEASKLDTSNKNIES